MTPRNTHIQAVATTSCQRMRLMIWYSGPTMIMPVQIPKLTVQLIHAVCSQLPVLPKMWITCDGQRMKKAMLMHPKTADITLIQAKPRTSLKKRIGIIGDAGTRHSYITNDTQQTMPGINSPRMWAEFHVKTGVVPPQETPRRNSVKPAVSSKSPKKSMRLMASRREKLCP